MREKIEIYVKEDKEVKLRKAYLIFLPLVIIVMKTINYLFYGDISKELTAYRVNIGFSLFLLIVTIYHAIKLVNIKKASKIKIENLDKKYSFTEDEGYKYGKEVSEEETEKDVIYMERMNKVCDKRSKEIASRMVKGNKLTERDVKYAVSIIENIGNEIDKIKDKYNKNEGLKIILDYNSRLSIIVDYKESLEKEPERLLEASDLINKYIPYLTILSKDYVEVGSHLIRDEYTDKVLSDTEGIIGELCDLILEDYKEYKTKELRELDLSIRAVKGVN